MMNCFYIHFCSNVSKKNKTVEPVTAITAAVNIEAHPINQAHRLSSIMVIKCKKSS